VDIHTYLRYIFTFSVGINELPAIVRNCIAQN
jgi:hypothetical protein